MDRPARRIQGAERHLDVLIVQLGRKSVQEKAKRESMLSELSEVTSSLKARGSDRNCTLLFRQYGRMVLEPVLPYRSGIDSLVSELNEAGSAAPGAGNACHDGEILQDVITLNFFTFLEASRDWERNYFTVLDVLGDLCQLT